MYFIYIFFLNGKQSCDIPVIKNPGLVYDFVEWKMLEVLIHYVRKCCANKIVDDWPQNLKSWRPGCVDNAIQDTF